MKIRFFYYWSHHEPVYGHAPSLWVGISILGMTDEQMQSSKNYLPYLDTDFPAHHPEDIDNVLSEIEKLERGEVDITYWGGDPGFEQTITREGVTFEHGTFGECPEWPLWSCSLAQYKAALLGWKKFIEMPKSIDSELIVELPDDGSSSFPHS
jgi:hypothetical protein